MRDAVAVRKQGTRPTRAILRRPLIQAVCANRAVLGIAPLDKLLGIQTRKLVERAKGLLQVKQGMSEPEAFKWIQRAAMDRRTTMKRVAEVVVETLDDSGGAASAG